MGTSKQLFSGTAKILEGRPVGYDGHVPHHPKNLAHVHDDDERRQYAKAFMTLAVHGGGVDASIAAKSLKARRHGGATAPAAKSLKPKSDQTISCTTEGRMLQVPFKQTVEGEQKMNVRDDAQGKNYF
ncbi:hypothetical protein STCU_02423 [Strigomonas culicis]|uniref:Uncharacterized protein n=1 Tax=Strigomonas culicis TaxID=28005 RepID=S9UK43_9TRYP|nr:hypothetical protein STCU_04708 [Strigomonas culicis]EPY33206.1 hypothetical protein STCU_02423 [Strigomonas culicis]|eukprot:EPY29134.1 hypothetical protein STCU_04708 [Strigomonas culicis]